jgi:hypothetical protein
MMPRSLSRVERFAVGVLFKQARPVATASNQCSDLTPNFIGTHRNAPLFPMEEGARVHHSYGSYGSYALSTYGSYEPRRAIRALSILPSPTLSSPQSLRLISWRAEVAYTADECLDRPTAVPGRRPTAGRATPACG